MLAGVDLAITVLPGADAAKLLEVGAKIAVKTGRRSAGPSTWCAGCWRRRRRWCATPAVAPSQTRCALRRAEESVGCHLCFPAGTLAAIPRGERAIQSLHPGEQVLAENPLSGTVEAEPVQAVIADPASPLLAVQLGDGSAITVTAAHPFWVERGVRLAGPGWMPAGRLRVGDELRTAAGTPVMVTGLRWGVGDAPVYTLTVATDHTFFCRHCTRAGA